MPYATLAQILQVAGFVTFLVVLAGGRLPATAQLRSFSPGAVYGLLLAIILFEFYVLGPYSFVLFTDEGDIAIPILKLIADSHDGGQGFVHGFAGGTAPALAYAVGSQVVSLERTLLQLLPVWLALVSMKVISMTLATAGVYAIAHRLLGADRWAAVGLGVVFAIHSEGMINDTFNVGFPIAVLPLVVYLVSALPTARRPWLILSALAAMSALPSPILIIHALLLCAVIGPLMLRRG